MYIRVYDGTGHQNYCWLFLIYGALPYPTQFSKENIFPKGACLGLLFPKGNIKTCTDRRIIKETKE